MGMVNCPKCGFKRIAESTERCPYCGYSVANEGTIPTEQPLLKVKDNPAEKAQYDYLHQIASDVRFIRNFIIATIIIAIIIVIISAIISIVSINRTTDIYSNLNR